MRRGVDAPGLAALIPSCPGYFRLALGMWSCAFTHERFVMKTLCPSRLPFPWKQSQLAGRGQRPRTCCRAQQGLLGNGGFGFPGLLVRDGRLRGSGFPPPSPASFGVGE